MNLHWQIALYPRKPSAFLCPKCMLAAWLCWRLVHSPVHRRLIRSRMLGIRWGFWGLASTGYKLGTGRHTWHGRSCQARWEGADTLTLIGRPDDSFPGGEGGGDGWGADKNAWVCLRYVYLGRGSTPRHRPCHWYGKWGPVPVCCHLDGRHCY